jgi:sulfonate transport system substrate-binding protein
VLLQHADGKTALIRGDVDAWAGLDPMMAQAEVEDGAKAVLPQPTPTPGASSMCARSS